MRVDVREFFYPKHAFLSTPGSDSFFGFLARLAGTTLRFTHCPFAFVFSLPSEKVDLATDHGGRPVFFSTTAAPPRHDYSAFLSTPQVVNFLFPRLSTPCQLAPGCLKQVSSLGHFVCLTSFFALSQTLDRNALVYRSPPILTGACTVLSRSPECGPLGRFSRPRLLFFSPFFASLAFLRVPRK